MGARLDAIFAVVNSSEFNSDEAMDAFERREYDRVVEMTLFHAIAGNSNAQTQLSPLYQLGLGVGRDVLEAERWLLKAAQQNNPVAWNNLGTLYASRQPELRHHRNFTSLSGGLNGSTQHSARTHLALKTKATSAG